MENLARVRRYAFHGTLWSTFNAHASRGAWRERGQTGGAESFWNSFRFVWFDFRVPVGALGGCAQRSYDGALGNAGR